MKWVKKKETVWLKLPDKPKKELPVVTAEPDYYWSFDDSIKELITRTESEELVDEDLITDGYIGKALWLDGITRYFMPKFDFRLGEKFTISFYILMDNLNGDFNVFFSKGQKHKVTLKCTSPHQVESVFTRKRLEYMIPMDL